MATNQRERAKRNEQTRDKRPYAIARYIRISPQKVKIVLDLIRGKGYQDAVNILTHTNKSSCMPILKVLNSAAANAENNQNMPKDSLFVAECYVMQGPTMKRMMPRAKGRGDRILKKTSHIKITLDEKIDSDFTRPRSAGTAKPKAVAAKAGVAKKAEVAPKPKVEKKSEVVATAKPKAEAKPKTPEKKTEVKTKVVAEPKKAALKSKETPAAAKQENKVAKKVPQQKDGE